MSTNLNQNPSTKKSNTDLSIAYRLFDLLGSMRLAVILLLVVAIASVIGTVLQQNQDYNDYIGRFGEFWFEVFIQLNMFDVYSSIWFSSIIIFLMLSISVCVYRNAPSMVREFNQFRLNIKISSLKTFQHMQQWHSDKPLPQLESELTQLFAIKGMPCRIKKHENYTVISGIRGRYNRLGYLFAHISVVLICVGAIVNANLELKYLDLTGQVKILKDNKKLSEIGEESILKVKQTSSIRGNKNIAEGETYDFIILSVRDGYILQKLPFDIYVKDFRVKYFATGQPKSYESDLTITDKKTNEKLNATIAVNHPLHYQGYSIYQASFQDGGSKLDLKLHALGSTTDTDLKLKIEIFKDYSINTQAGKGGLSFTEFRYLNLEPEQDKTKKRKFRNWGPSVQFKYTALSGDAFELKVYKDVQDFEGRKFYVSTSRKLGQVSSGFFLFPLDQKQTLKRFINFRKIFNDQAKVLKSIQLVVQQFVKHVRSRGLTKDSDKVEQRLEQSFMKYINLFTQQGEAALFAHWKQTVPEVQYKKFKQLYSEIFIEVIRELYLSVLKSEGIDVSKGLGEFDRSFFVDAYRELSRLPLYGVPYFFEMEKFKHIEATGLQITKAPGNGIVYTGCFFLSVGVFIMLYMRQRRYWFCLYSENDGNQILLGGASNRKSLELADEFASLSKDADAVINA